MELYHLHTKGIKDNYWKEKKEIRIDESFENRLAKRVNNFSTTNVEDTLSGLLNLHSILIADMGYTPASEYNLCDLLNTFIYMRDRYPDLNKYKMELLKQSQDIIHTASMFKREMAMEQYRKDCFPNRPSRMHCLYALDEKDLDFWKYSLHDGDLELFRIDVLDQVFKTSEQFIPAEKLNYKDFYDASYSYWNPKQKKLDNEKCEYLIKGKVKILEKVDEFKKH